jgi:SAM-dependent methyltransferase
MGKHYPKAPSQQDLEIWQYAEEELFSYLYKGVAGRFQIQGHRILGKWSRNMQERVVVEIGCGHGHHLLYSGHPYRKYIGIDHKFNRAHILAQRESHPMAINGDVFQLPFQDNSIDCVLSIYIFEHLRILRKNLLEVKRVLKTDGKLLIALPAEGGFLYGLGRSLTSKPYMEKKYGIDYNAIVHYEHVNTYPEVFAEVSEIFKIANKRYSPFPFLPTYHLNAVICLQAENA